MTCLTRAHSDLPTTTQMAIVNAIAHGLDRIAPRSRISIKNTPLNARLLPNASVGKLDIMSRLKSLKASGANRAQSVRHTSDGSMLSPNTAAVALCIVPLLELSRDVWHAISDVLVDPRRKIVGVSYAAALDGCDLIMTTKQIGFADGFAIAATPA